MINEQYKDTSEQEKPPKPFPFNTLPKSASEYGRELSEKIQVSDSIVGSTILAVCSLLVQGKGNIVTDFDKSPLSLFLLTVADSGERKSTIEKILICEIEAKEQNCYEKYEIESEKARDHIRKWEHQKAEAIKNKNPDDLQDLYENKPEIWHDPKIIVSDPTIEGLFKQYAMGRSCLGLFPNEGATVFGGY